MQVLHCTYKKLCYICIKVNTMKEPKETKYVLHLHIDRKVAKKFKVECAKNDISMTSALNKLLHDAIEQQ